MTVLEGAMNDSSRVPQRARVVLAAFLLTFMAARIVVFLIMAHRVPDLYLHLGGTHVHHLNYGIFLLSGVGGYLVFGRPAGRRLSLAAIVYGIGLALTFDEFGMWLHLGGPYWQRASFDAVVVIAGLLGFIAAAPALNQLRQAHWLAAGALLATAVLFGYLLNDSFRYAGERLEPAFQRLEEQGPAE
jgi:hypothetical protein